jgi:superfamily II DNA or RNA helicase
MHDPIAAILTLEQRPYQIEGAEWLLHHKRAILADSQGLGKTATAFMAAHQRRPTCIIAPAFWSHHWHQFVQKYAPLSPIIHAGTDTRINRMQALDAATSALNVGALDYLILSAEMMPAYAEWLTHVLPRFKTVIIDEAHMFRSHRSKRAQLAAKLLKHTPNIFLLTATPQMTDVDDYYQLLHILDPKQFSSYYRFLDDHCRTTRLAYKIAVNGIRNPTEFATMLRRYMLRRTYSEVGRDLPPIMPTTYLDFDLTDEERTRYRQLKNEYRNTLTAADGTLTNTTTTIPLSSAGEVLHQLRTLTAAQKPHIIADLLRQEARTPPPPYIIFTWYKETAHQIALHLSTALSPHSPLVITGDTPADERAHAAKHAPHIVATIASMSVGIDLSDHKLLIFAEQSYVPGMMNQAITRVHRDTTNTLPVRPYILRANRSIDKAVHRAQSRRDATATSILASILTADITDDER